MSEGELIVPEIPKGIIDLFKKDYPEIKELLEYKRDATLIFLKSYGAMAIYKGSLGLDVAKDVKDWDEFLQFAEHYTTLIVQKGLQKYQAKEDTGGKNNKNPFQKLELRLMKPAVSMISNIITQKYFDRFPSWPKSGTQEDFINIDINSNLAFDDIRIYWMCTGEIDVKDTRYDIPRNGCLYRAEFSGKPEFLISYFDMEKIRQCNVMAIKNMKMIKKKLDELDEKLLIQKMDKLLLNGFEF